MNERTYLEKNLHQEREQKVLLEKQNLELR